MAYKLAELIDIPALQRLMDLFHAATAIPVGIIDADGSILVATGWKDICTRFHRVQPLTAARCRQSDDYIKSQLYDGSYVQYKCRNGLWDVAVPILIADE
ncbi:MAG TPA: PocR ligand-binding domain-containing protein, partial [Geobacteraceae bacterium]